MVYFAAGQNDGAFARSAIHEVERGHTINRPFGIDSTPQRFCRQNSLATYVSRMMTNEPWRIRPLTETCAKCAAFDKRVGAVLGRKRGLTDADEKRVNQIFQEWEKHRAHAHGAFAPNEQGE